MIIDVDIGNTRIKWRDSGKPEILRVITSVDAIPAEWERLPAGSRIRVSSVVGREQTSAFAAAVKERCAIDIEIATVKNPFGGVTIAYADPARLGVDRWLALLAVHHQFPGRDFVIMHGGTAVVADFLTSDGLHIGGFIAPGVSLALSALMNAAPGLDLRDIGSLKGRKAPGTTTLESIQSGYTALYRGFLREMVAEASVLPAPNWVFAGGDGDLFCNLWRDLWLEKKEAPESLVVEALVLDGLAIALP